MPSPIRRATGAKRMLKLLPTRKATSAKPTLKPLRIRRATSVMPKPSHTPNPTSVTLKPLLIPVRQNTLIHLLPSSNADRTSESYKRDAEAIAYPESYKREADAEAIAYPESYKRETDAEAIAYPESYKREADAEAIAYPGSYASLLKEMTGLLTCG